MTESFRNKYKLYIIYLIFMIFLWIRQVLDWWVFRLWDDPIWHLLFYFAFMPFFSFLFWILIWGSHKWWIFPIYALLVTIFVFVFFSNWWLKILMNLQDLCWYSFLYIVCPSFLAAIIWVIITRIVLLVWKLFKHKKQTKK